MPGTYSKKKMKIMFYFNQNYYFVIILFARKGIMRFLFAKD